MSLILPSRLEEASPSNVGAEPPLGASPIDGEILKPRATKYQGTLSPTVSEHVAIHRRPNLSSWDARGPRRPADVVATSAADEDWSEWQSRGAPLPRWAVAPLRPVGAVSGIYMVRRLDGALVSSPPGAAGAAAVGRDGPRRDDADGTLVLAVDRPNDAVWGWLELGDLCAVIRYPGRPSAAQWRASTAAPPAAGAARPARRRASRRRRSSTDSSAAAQQQPPRRPFWFGWRGFHSGGRLRDGTKPCPDQGLVFLGGGLLRGELRFGPRLREDTVRFSARRVNARREHGGGDGTKAGEGDAGCNDVGAYSAKELEERYKDILSWSPTTRVAKFGQNPTLL